MSKNKKKIIVYTDGSCAGNGRMDAVGGIGIHFPNGELDDVSKVYRIGHCTNQRTELYAILTAIKYVKQSLGLKNYQIEIMTDSEYAINCITRWVNGWIKNGWITKDGSTVSNKDFIEKIYYYYEKYNIKLTHVRGHVGIEPNEKADKLATKATDKALNEKKKVSKVEINYYSDEKKHTNYYNKQPSRRSYRDRKYNDDDIVVELVESS